MGMIGVKLIDQEHSVRCIKIIHQHCNSPLSEILKAVESGDYLLTCDSYSSDGIRNVLALSYELETAGKATLLLNDGEPVTPEFLENLLESYAETERQVELDMEREAEAENCE